MSGRHSDFINTVHGAGQCVGVQSTVNQSGCVVLGTGIGTLISSNRSTIFVTRLSSQKQIDHLLLYYESTSHTMVHQG